MKDKEKQINRTDNFGELSDTVSIPNKEKTISVSKFEDIKLTIPCKKEIEEKQIEEMRIQRKLEMTKDILNGISGILAYEIQKLAEHLISLNYVKLPENAFILTNDNAEELANLIITSPQMQSAMSDLIMAWQKETAEKILKKGEEFYKMSYHKSNAIHRLAEWIKDTFGL